MAATARALKTQPALPHSLLHAKVKGRWSGSVDSLYPTHFLGRAFSWFSSPGVLAFSVFLALPDRADISSLLALEVCGFR